MKTYAEIINDCETLAQDAGVDPSGVANQVFATAELDSFMPAALSRISYLGKPWQIKTTKATVADTRDITLTTGDKWRLLGILKLEYLTDQDPPVYRGLTRFGDVVSILIDKAPTSADDIYFFFNKIHILLKETGADSTAGKIKTTAAVGAVSLALDNLGTGTINEMTTIAITGDTTVYYVIIDATIATNEATVSIWPPLTAEATAATVITLSVTASSLDDIPLEDFLARWLAAKACISKATKSYSQVNQAIATIANSATAIADLAALTALATIATTGDIALGRASSVLGATAIAEIGAIIDKAETATTTVTAGSFVVGTIYTIVTVGTTNFTLIGASSSNVDVVFTATGVGTGTGTAVTNTGDIALGRAEIVKALAAIVLANAEFDKIATEVDLAKTALASGNSLINTIPIGGGAAEYMGQASSDVGVSQGYLLTGQSFLQEASADLNNVANDLRTASLELQTSGAKAQEATANFTNATSHFNAATADFRAAGEKANEAIANLRLVASRLKISQGGLNYEQWGRTELAQVEAELRAYGGYPTSKRYPRD